MLESRIKKSAMAVGFIGVLYEKGLDISCHCLHRAAGVRQLRAVCFPQPVRPLRYQRHLHHDPVRHRRQRGISEPADQHPSGNLVLYGGQQAHGHPQHGLCGHLLFRTADSGQGGSVRLCLRHGERHQQNSRTHGRGRDSGLCVLHSHQGQRLYRRHGFHFRHCPQAQPQPDVFRHELRH